MARCKRCHRVLITAEAVEAGYGAVCFRKMFGKPLPSAKEPRAPRAPSSKSRAKGAKASKRRPVEPIPLFAQDVVCRLGPDGEPITNVPQRIVYHSPDGFAWGYGGSGPAELALNILSLYVEEREAYELHQDFKRRFVESMPPEGGTIPRDSILEWIQQKRSERL